ncbi:MAG: homoserine dehydrogenase [Chloroflexi bacterium]|nr:homoserine dehydrogenase [Chloroflexota bacterium]
MGKKESIGIGLMGLGVVGSGVAQTLREKSIAIAQQVGCPLEIKGILVRDPSKKRAIDIPHSLMTTDPLRILNDPDVDIVIEVIGGETEAFRFIKGAIAKGKHVVTANKEVISKHSSELFELAGKHRVDIRYEASVGGGIPLIAPFKRDLLANNILAIHAIINGTTNYILTRMAKDGLDFDTALKQAQKLGYAEPDPANDIEGVDAAYKLAILATLAFRTEIHPEDIHYEGISRLTARDFRYAREFGYAIKLLAIAKKEKRSIQVRVHPAFVPEDLLLANVDGVFNAIQVEGDLVGRVIFYGRGAGSSPTASAIAADVIQLAQNIRLGLRPKPHMKLLKTKRLTPMSQIRTRYYMRLTVVDSPGVLAKISKILGDHAISIASVIQKETDEKTGTAEIVIMTHPAQESALQKALQKTSRLKVVKEIGNFIRVED